MYIYVFDNNKYDKSCIVVGIYGMMNKVYKFNIKFV